jgi:hypothetical protein
MFTLTSQRNIPSKYASKHRASIPSKKSGASLNNTILQSFNSNKERQPERMSIPPNARQAWSALTKMAANAQSRTGGPGGSGGPSPKGVGAGAAGLILLVGGGLVANNALFNVDGGHRAIKYTRVGGVKPEIFNEGMSLTFEAPSTIHEELW